MWWSFAGIRSMATATRARALPSRTAWSHLLRPAPDRGLPLGSRHGWPACQRCCRGPRCAVPLPANLQAIVDEITASHPGGLTLDELGEELLHRPVTYADIDEIIGA